MKKLNVLFLFIIILVFFISTFYFSCYQKKIELSGAKKFHSKYLKSDILYFPQTVFTPIEAEHCVLPFMYDHKALFRGKTVLDIGTGSGIIGLYAAKLGAKKVIATDIDQNAVNCARLNSERFGFSSIFEVRLVPANDISAYSVINSDETFDIIISNPPYSIDLDSPHNTPFTDKGDLGMSIIKGLKIHLKPNGSAVLLYNSYFYHQVMVKFAQYVGYDVTHYNPEFLTPWEADVIFNYYLKRLLEYNNIPSNALHFDWKKDRGGIVLFPMTRARVGLSKIYRGLIIISKKT